MNVMEGPALQQESFCSLLRNLRIRAGLTQQHLADLSALSVRAIRDLESGRVHRPRLETVRLLADGLGLEGRARARFVSKATEGVAQGAYPPATGTTIAAAPLTDGVTLSIMREDPSPGVAPPDGAIRQVSVIRLDDGDQPGHLLLEIKMWRGDSADHAAMPPRELSVEAG
ncbi:hypothetical protein GCM10022226_68380 [Sphaerisporangium flaviroseum]|uniref:HTH cro/C1-type domain-containing protein n=1 Tax=Sphaerisporangium flaviroseum TaxID=509199 RepID=A0ABP7J7B4_9ACTN